MKSSEASKGYDNSKHLSCTLQKDNNNQQAREKTEEDWRLEERKKERKKEINKIILFYIILYIILYNIIYTCKAEKKCYPDSPKAKQA